MAAYLNLCSLREIYVLGGLEEAAARCFELHLRYCRDCPQEMSMLSKSAQWMLSNFEDVDPPSDMRDRIFNYIFADEDQAH